MKTYIVKLRAISEMQIGTATGTNDIVDKLSDILYTAGNFSGKGQSFG